ncbi:MAG TPA: HhH-GPD-type base excision DNA repair protein [Gaiellaceae bacterium]|nr:HhH-GPD-type base excision DNA repair protein [Gaiellaceae bacterium]
MATTTKPEKLHFTGNDEADRLLADDPFALLMGFALDQQVPVQTAFTGPLKLKQRLGTLDPGTIAGTDPAKLEAAFREKPAIHRFPGNMARRVQDLAALVAGEYGGNGARIWSDAADSDDLRRRISDLPGFGEMKIKAFSAVLAKRFGVETARGLAPSHPTLGDVDSPEALERYQTMKREHKARLKAQRQ